MRALDGSEYMPGLVGLNNMSRNDYVNVIVQVCCWNPFLSREQRSCNALQQPQPGASRDSCSTAHTGDHAHCGCQSTG